MSEILAALPRIFGARRGDDYARLVREGSSDQMLARVVSDTNRQMTRAYETVLSETAKTQPRSRSGHRRSR